MYKITFDKEKCLGCGWCARASENWEIKNEDGRFKAKPKKTELEEIGKNDLAAKNCPGKAIKIEEIS